MPCERGTVFGPHPTKPDVRSYLRLACKRWDCPDCGPRKAKRYRLRIAHHATELKLQRFCTLTLDPQKLPTKDSRETVAYLRKTWSKMRILLTRKFGRSPHFIALVELHPGDGPNRGVAHLHFLLANTDSICKQTLSELWQSVGGGSNVDIAWVDLHNVAKYLTWYMGKDFLGGIAGIRRISTSQTIRLIEKIKRGWAHTKAHIEEVMYTWGLPYENILSDQYGPWYFEVPPP